MGSEGHTLHMLFFPFMAQGHMLPMLDIASLFAARGVRSTVLTTPANIPIVQPYIDRHLIQLHTVPFPPTADLPQGCENLSSLLTTELHRAFFQAVGLLREPFSEVLNDLVPDCVVTDMFFPWTYDAAAELGIPRIVFHGVGFFSLCIFDSFDRYNLIENLKDIEDNESIVIPGLPHRIELLKSQIPDFHKPDSPAPEFFRKARDAESKSYGVIVNSFYELEPDYAQHYREVVGRKAWHVGPVALTSERCSKTSCNNSQIVNWLDGKKPGSVIYVCFGSLSEFSAAQLREIVLGLEASGHSFVFVVRRGGGNDWIPQGFEERVGNRGLIVDGWAPQVVILNHPSVNAFLTHCGWNSSLEGISAGLPLVTWPLFAEQFYNEKLIVEVLKIGVPVGAKKCERRAEEREVVEADAVERAVRRVMDGGEEGEGRRRRAKEVGEKARRAVEKGGSSYEDVGRLKEELMSINRGFVGVGSRGRETGTVGGE